ncbi:SDR family oxidoreductase [Mycobacterium sp. 134]|uniref:SDR family oxidoreductase n=1 Tax=unclassified Mycobacterium TaxID=2642494 RepID=UPI0007FD68B3|nr:SDR family oxidoreductase [Mycobacterium sp. E802]OBG83424.1 ketoreductase [Mycobacterium sp. E802]
MTWRKKTILVTGASGVVGRALIDELAGDFDIVCMRNRTPVADVRVSEFVGSFEQPMLGMSSSDYALLARRADAIVHVAAATSWKEDPARIREVNLGGPRALLQLATVADAPLYFLSTAFVANPPAPNGHSPGAAAYVRSKIDAEQLVREHPARTVIVRPSIVSGDSQSGRMAGFQGLHAVLGAIVRGSAPMLPMPEDALIDFVPQDLLAGALGQMLREGTDQGEYWLTAGHHALHALEIREMCMGIASDIGLSPPTPRFIPGEAVDRLILPLLEDSLPPSLQSKFRDLLEFAWLFQTSEPLPNSHAALGLQERITGSALRRSLTKSMMYWAAAKGLIAGGRDEQVA